MPVGRCPDCAQSVRRSITGPAVEVGSRPSIPLVRSVPPHLGPLQWTGSGPASLVHWSCREALAAFSLSGINSPSRRLPTGKKKLPFQGVNGASDMGCRTQRCGSVRSINSFPREMKQRVSVVVTRLQFPSLSMFIRGAESSRCLRVHTFLESSAPVKTDGGTLSQRSHLNSPADLAGRRWSHVGMISKKGETELRDKLSRETSRIMEHGVSRFGQGTPISRAMLGGGTVSFRLVGHTINCLESSFMLSRQRPWTVVGLCIRAGLHELSDTGSGGSHKLARAIRAFEWRWECPDNSGSSVGPLVPAVLFGPRRNSALLLPGSLRDSPETCHVSSLPIRMPEPQGTGPHRVVPATSWQATNVVIFFLTSCVVQLWASTSFRVS